MGEAENKARDVLVAELLPGIEPWQVYLVYRAEGWTGMAGEGWRAEMSPRLRPKRAPWRRARFDVSAGSDPWDGGAACLYKTPRAAVEALRDELLRLHAEVGVILGLESPASAG